MYSLVASSLYYSVARACATHNSNLAACGCGIHKKAHMNPSFKWGGCSDNTRYAKKFTTKFLQLKKHDTNLVAKHNMMVGMKTVQKNFKVKCKCAGLSGKSKMWIQEANLLKKIWFQDHVR